MGTPRGKLLCSFDNRASPGPTRHGQGEGSRGRGNSIVRWSVKAYYAVLSLYLTDLAIGTTRDNFAGKPVKELQYSAYNKLALRTMMSIAKDVLAQHSLKAIAMIHRLGVVPVGEESILIAVSAPHRQAAWRAGEQALEDCKAKVEVWKREEFEGEEGVWRANRDGIMGHKVSRLEDNKHDGI